MVDRADETSILIGAKSPEERKRILADIFMEHRSKLHAMVKLRLDPRLRPRVDPSDVLQEMFLEAFRRLDGYLRRPKVPVFIWLRFLALQKLQDFHRRHLVSRKRDVRRESPDGFPEASSAVLAESLMSREAPPSAGISGEERKKAIEAVLETLPSIDREILALRFFEGLTGPEVARVLGMKADTVRSRYLRVLESLRLGTGRPREGGCG